jgi:hypothetical protein
MLRRRNLGRRSCKKNGGWTPLLDTGLLIWLLAGYGMTLDGDGKVMYWDGMGGGPRVTFAVRPTPVISASYGEKTVLDMSGGCYGTAALSTNNGTTILGVINSDGGADRVQWSCGAAVRTLYGSGTTKFVTRDSTQVDLSRNPTLPSIIMCRYTGTAAARAYTHAKTPLIGSQGSGGGAQTTVSLGAYVNGTYPSQGKVASVVLTTTQTDANDLLLLEQAATNYAMTLGA